MTAEHFTKIDHDGQPLAADAKSWDAVADSRTGRPDCPSDWFWTSTPYAPSPGVYAWIVNFHNGYAYYLDRDYYGFVRAVRGGQF